MAAECARNALLQKVVDNREDAGSVISYIVTLVMFLTIGRFCSP